MSEQTVNDTITNAVIGALANDQERYTVCRAFAEGARAVPQELEYEDDRLVGQAVCERYGKEIAGELTGYVNWVLVGKHFREELDQ